MKIEDNVAQNTKVEIIGLQKNSSHAFALTGFVIAGFALVSAVGSFLLLLGLTPVTPSTDVIFAAMIINFGFVLVLLGLVIREVYRVINARKTRKAASRLHVRIIALFSIVAIVPAVLVAVIATITLDVGLDRWFSIRTKSIINSSQSVAQAYVDENSRYLQGQTVSMANDLDAARTLYRLDRSGFEILMTRQAFGRGFIAAVLVNANSQVVARANLKTANQMPPIPPDALKQAVSGNPALIPPGRGNLVGAVFGLQKISNLYLYTIRAVNPEVMRSLALMENVTSEYKELEDGRGRLQLAFGILYLGFALIVLLIAIWTAIAVADRIVRPIRMLITAADKVAGGNFNIEVPVRSSDGDVGSLANTFNIMITEIRQQRDEIVEARDLMDERRRFTEAVLSGVSSGVFSIEEDNKIVIHNRTAQNILSKSNEPMVGQILTEVVPEFSAILTHASMMPDKEHHDQVTLMRFGKEITLNVQVSTEVLHDGSISYVVTIDDITNLLIAQRSSAWADIARRIAHEIKNPLTPIQLSAERLQRRYGKQIKDDDRQVFDQCTNTIIRQVGDIGRMVDEFSDFARMPEPTKENIDLRSVIKDAVFLREVSRNDIEFIRDFPDEPLMVSVDPRMIGQAIGNLIKNATEAIDAILEDDKRDKLCVKVHAYKQNDTTLIVDVIDNGKGLPAENRHRILEPYMTMRDKGTGLGLSIVKKIIDDHDGQLELHDAPKDFDQGHGAMIRVRLPLNEGTRENNETQEKK